MANINRLEDDAIHQFAIIDDKLIIQANFNKHFGDLGHDTKHGYLIFDKGQLVNEGSNFPDEEFANLYSEVVIV